MRSNFCSQMTIVHYRLLHWLLNSVAAMIPSCKLSRHLISWCLPNKYLSIPNRNRICWTSVLNIQIESFFNAISNTIQQNFIMICQSCCHGFTDSFIHSIVLHLNTRIMLSFQNYSREKSTFLCLFLLKESKHLFWYWFTAVTTSFFNWSGSSSRVTLSTFSFSMLLSDGPTRHAKRCVDVKIGLSHQQSRGLLEGV